MNLTPTRSNRLIIFNAGGVRQAPSEARHSPQSSEAVALIADEMLLAARHNMPYVDIVDMAGRF